MFGPFGFFLRQRQTAEQCGCLPGPACLGLPAWACLPGPACLPACLPAWAGLPAWARGGPSHFRGEKGVSKHRSLPRREKLGQSPVNAYAFSFSRVGDARLGKREVGSQPVWWCVSRTEPCKGAIPFAVMDGFGLRLSGREV